MVPQTDPRIAFVVLSPDIDQAIIPLFLFYLVALGWYYSISSCRSIGLEVGGGMVGDMIDLKI